MPVIHLRGREAPRDHRSTMETMLLTQEQVREWKAPPFQRPLKVNEKVRSVSEQIKHEGGVIRGIITLGRLTGDQTRTIYLVDGQHRREAYLLTGLPECIVDVRAMQFDTMGDMALEFVELQSHLVKLTPDDILRGIEGHVPTMAALRKNCPFLGYDSIRRSDHSPILSMSVVLRCWDGSLGEVPNANRSGRSSQYLAQQLELESAQRLTAFLLTAYAAWGRDYEYRRLWSALNLTLCMWLWRQMVGVSRERTGAKRHIMLTPDQFRKCLLALSASAEYLDFLVGRAIGERDRGPCYKRIKALFTKRLVEDAPAGSKKKILMPAPVWDTR